MTKQEEIREGVAREIARLQNDFTWQENLPIYLSKADTFLRYLHYKGLRLPNGEALIKKLDTP